MPSAAWIRFLCEELEPSPGRIAGTLRDTLSVTLAVLLIMTLRIHTPAIGVYYIFLLARQRPSLSLRSGVHSMAAVCAGVGSCLLLIQVTDSAPMARVLGLAICMLICGFLFVASNHVASATAFCLFWFSTLAGWDAHRPANDTVESALWLIAATGLSIGCALVVEFLFASRSPVAELRHEMDLRLRTAHRIFTLYAEGAPAASMRSVKHTAVQLSHAGQQRMQRLYERIVERSLKTDALPPGTRVRIPILADLMDVVAAFLLSRPAEADADERLQSKLLANRISQLLPNPSAIIEAQAEAPNATGVLVDAGRILFDLASFAERDGDSETGFSLRPLPPANEPVFVDDAFTNPTYIFFGLKMSLCATACYILYNAVGWPGIATSVVTVMITALSTTAAMKQKQLYRIAGASIGGGIGIFSVSILFPLMDSITPFLLLVASITFLAAWWARSPRTSYAGIQIALAFYLVAFQSFSAPIAMAPARDRVAGVALGLLAMWFAFDQLWPLRTTSAMEDGLRSLLAETALLFDLFAASDGEPAGMEADKLRHTVGQRVMRMRDLRETVAYEIGGERVQHMEWSERLFQAIAASASIFWTRLIMASSRNRAERTAEDFAIAKLIRGMEAEYRNLRSEESGGSAPEITTLLSPQEVFFAPLEQLQTQIAEIIRRQSAVPKSPQSL